METAIPKKISASEFLLGPQKPRLTHSSAQYKSDTAKMVFGKKVKVKEARAEWQGHFARAFARAHLSEDLAGVVFEQALLDEGEVTEELLEDVFVGLLSEVGTDDLEVIFEAIDELVEELWLERMDRTKELIKKSAMKHGKSVAKGAGFAAAGIAAGELDKHLKSVKTKKGSAGNVLKHAARGALKQIGKDPKRAKEIAAQSLTKLARKGTKEIIQRGLKMVFMHWAKTEDATIPHYTESAEYNAGDTVKQSDLPKFLYHGSPFDFKKLENTGAGIHLTVAPGLASAFVIKRESVAKGRSGKIRNAHSIWNKPLEDLSEPMKHHEVSVLPSRGAKNPITDGESGKSNGFVYKIETAKILGKDLYINRKEPREIVFTGKSIPVAEKVAVSVKWTTKLEKGLKGGARTNTFAKSLSKTEEFDLYTEWSDETWVAYIESGLPFHENTETLVTK